MILAGEIVASAQGLLNDPSGAIYPVQAMLPMVNKAYRELQLKVSALGIGITKEVSLPVPVIVGQTNLSPGSGLPNELLYPIHLSERAPGTSDRFVDMEERDWEPNTKPSTVLGLWVWREESIKLIGATQEREVLVRFVKTLGGATETTSQITILDSDVWLAQRTAALAALLLGSNPSRATALMNDLNASGGTWDDLRSTLVKRKQNVPVRRRRTRWRKQ